MMDLRCRRVEVDHARRDILRMIDGIDVADDSDDRDVGADGSVVVEVDDDIGLAGRPLRATTKSR